MTALASFKPFSTRSDTKAKKQVAKSPWPQIPSRRLMSIGPTKHYNTYTNRSGHDVIVCWTASNNLIYIIAIYLTEVNAIFAIFSERRSNLSVVAANQPWCHDRIRFHPRTIHRWNLQKKGFHDICGRFYTIYIAAQTLHEVVARARHCVLSFYLASL